MREILFIMNSSSVILHPNAFLLALARHLSLFLLSLMFPFCVVMLISARREVWKGLK
jgi:hypothetical protein